MLKSILQLAYYIPASLRDALPHRIQRLSKVQLQKLQLAAWRADGCPPPPPHLVKVEMILAASKTHQVRTFIETGTYMGDMLDSVKSHFTELHSIELQQSFAQRAKSIFSNNHHIHIHVGDSAQVLPILLKKVKKPALFWLDAHYSGGDTARAEVDTPIESELRAIILHPVRNHVILIDDARLFTGKNGYPTLRRLRSFCKKMAPQYFLRLEHDTIQLHPKNNSK